MAQLSTSSSSEVAKHSIKHCTLWPMMVQSNLTNCLLCKNSEILWFLILAHFWIWELMGLKLMPITRLFLGTLTRFDPTRWSKLNLTKSAYRKLASTGSISSYSQSVGEHTSTSLQSCPPLNKYTSYTRTPTSMKAPRPQPQKPSTLLSNS